MTIDQFVVDFQDPLIWIVAFLIFLAFAKSILIVIQYMRKYFKDRFRL